MDRGRPMSWRPWTSPMTIRACPEHGIWGGPGHFQGGATVAKGAAAKRGAYSNRPATAGPNSWVPAQPSTGPIRRRADRVLLHRAKPGQPAEAGLAKRTASEAQRRMWHRERQGAAGQRQAVQQPAAELCQEPVRAGRGAGLVHQPSEERGQIHAATGARFARGSFREVVPVHRLAYSFGWDGSEVVPPGSSLVEIDLLDEQPNGTLLRLTHTGLPNAEQCAGHAEGWAHYLDRLVEVAAGRDPGPDPWHGRTGDE